MALDKTFASGEILSSGDVNGHLLGLWIPINKSVIASGSPVTSVSFASLDSNFRIFRLTYSTASTGAALTVRCNNDTAANYQSLYLYTDQTGTPDATNTNSATSMEVGPTANGRSVGQVIIGKPVLGVIGGLSGTVNQFDSNTSMRAVTVAGKWNNTTALINRIDLIGSAAFYGSVALEGMRGV